MEEKLTVKTRDGQTWEIYVIMEFQVENYPDDYIAYTFGEKNGENVTSFISKMKEDNNTIILDSIHFCFQNTYIFIFPMKVHIEMSSVREFFFRLPSR